MDRVTDLSATVQREVEDYAGPALLGRTLAISDPQRRTYTVLVVPDQPAKFDSGIVVLARVAGEQVIIEEDLSDRPLWKELLRVGIPREQIVLAYAGEPIPAAGVS
jgi:XisI protein